MTASREFDAEIPQLLQKDRRVVDLPRYLQSLFEQQRLQPADQ